MKIQLPEFTMVYTDQGEGIPLLLIHGYPLNRNLWKPQVEALSDCARLIAPDLRGHGDSEPTGGIYTMEILAQDCLDLLLALNIKQQVIVGGLSMGGYIALAFYRLFPERVAGLILTATRAGADTPEGKANRLQAVEQARSQGVRSVVESMAARLLAPNTYASNPDFVQWLITLMTHISPEAVEGDLLGMKDRMDSLPLLPNIQVPVQIIHGVEDRIVPLQEAIQMQELLPHASLCALPDAGHLSNLEKPESFNDTVRAFLQQWKA